MIFNGEENSEMSIHPKPIWVADTIEQALKYLLLKVFYIQRHQRKPSGINICRSNIMFARSSRSASLRKLMQIHDFNSNIKSKLNWISRIIKKKTKKNIANTCKTVLSQKTICLTIINITVRKFNYKHAIEFLYKTNLKFNCNDE